MKGLKWLPLVFTIGLLPLTGCEKFVRQVEAPIKEQKALVHFAENKDGMVNILRRTIKKLHKVTEADKRFALFNKAEADIQKLKSDFMNSADNQPKAKVMVIQFVPYAMAVVDFLKTRDTIILPLVLSDRDLYLAAKDPDISKQYLALFTAMPKKLANTDSLLDELKAQHVKKLNVPEFSEELQKAYNDYAEKDYASFRELMLKETKELLELRAKTLPVFEFLSANPQVYKVVDNRLFFPNKQDLYRYQAIVESLPSDEG